MSGRGKGGKGLGKGSSAKRHRKILCGNILLLLEQNPGKKKPEAETN